MIKQNQYVSNAEAAIRLSVIDDRNWSSWLADDRRKRNKKRMLPYFKTSDRKVWYDPMHLDMFITQVRKSKKTGGKSKIIQQNQIAIGSPFITTRQINGEDHVEVLGFGTGDTYTFSDARAFAIDLVACLKNIAKRKSN